MTKEAYDAIEQRPEFQVDRITNGSFYLSPVDNKVKAGKTL